MALKLFVASWLAVGLVACGSTSPTAPVETSVTAPAPDTPTPTPTPSPEPEPEPSPKPEPADPQPTGPAVNRLTGVIIDALGRPLEGVTVSAVFGTSDETDVEGRFEVISGAPIGSNYAVFVHKPNYGYLKTFVTGPTAIITLYIGFQDDSPEDLK